MKDEEIRKAVRESYGKIAVKEATSCGPASSCGCGCGSTQDTVSKAIGYSDEELSAVPEGANLGLGCGNPTALASLKEGEVVLDLGSGAGFDCFLTSDKVGESGRVIGIDMTAEMIEKARENARKSNYGNVEFRLVRGVSGMLHVPRHTDYLSRNWLRPVTCDSRDVFTDRILIRPEALRHRLVDDHR